MSCASIQDRLFEYVDGSLDTITHASIASHVASCVDCAALVASLEHTESDETLTQAVLNRTTNDACEQSADRIPDWIDGALDTLDAELVAGHVAHCGDCKVLANVMQAMAIDLPALAEIQPDPSFADDVMAATADRLPDWADQALAAFAEVESARQFLTDVMAATSYKMPTLSWGARFEQWLAGLMQRPRIAWEGAYVATMFLVLLIAFPGSPLAGVSQKALELAQTDPDKIEQPFVELEAGINTAASEAWFSTRTVARTIAVKASVGSGDVYRKTKRDIGTLWASIASDPVNDATETQEEISTNGESK
jgi:predicted anti-sigma-YlaC factor YlaD